MVKRLSSILARVSSAILGHLAWGTALVIALGGTAGVGQSVRDVPLGTGFPSTWVGPDFSDSDTLAVMGGGAIHVFRDLLGSSTQSVSIPTGVATPVSAWRRVGPSEALYRGAGPDGVRSADDVLIFVSQLPRNPTLTNLLIRDTEPDFVPVTPGRAVGVSGNAVQVLSWGPTGVSLRPLPCPYLFASGDRFRGGSVGDDGFVLMTAGPDGQTGTADDQLAVVTGISTPTPTLTMMVPPLGVTLSGMITLPESRLVVMWQDLGLPTIRLWIGSGFDGVPSWTTFDVTPPANPSPFFAPQFRARPVGPAAVVVDCEDDLGPGEGHVFVSDLTGTPTVMGAWYDDWGFGEDSMPLSDAEVARWSAVTPSQVTYTDFITGAITTVNQAWNIRPQIRRPSAPSLVIATDVPSPQPSVPDQAFTVVYPDPRVPTGSVAFSTTGRWGGQGFDVEGRLWPVRITNLGPGAVSGFLADSTGNLTALRVVTVPSVSPVGMGLVGSPSPVTVNVPGGVPGVLGTSLTIQVVIPPTWASPALLAVADAVRAPITLDPGLFAPGSLQHLDLSGLVILTPVNLVGGVGSSTWAVGGLLGPLAGRPLFVQVVAADTMGVLWVSDAWRLILN